MLSAAPSSGMCFGALALSVIGVVQLARWWLREPEGAEHIRELDSDRGERKFSRAAREVAYQFKAKFGELKYTNANKILAGEFVRNTWAGTDMRAYDVALHTPMAVEACLTPLVGAVEAATYNRMAAVKARRAAVDSPK